MGRKAQHLAACALLTVAGPVMADTGNLEAGQAAAAGCMACHGTDGNSPALPPLAEQWPKIAGQMPEYIIKQLYDYKSGRRRNSQMTPQAQNVADVNIANIASFFAAQRMKANEAADKRLLAHGEKLFLRGKGRPDPVAACAACHGKNGAGQRGGAPAVGGQHARYAVKQLKAFRDGSRTNDAGRVMRNIALRLDDGDIAALAEYMSTLGY